MASTERQATRSNTATTLTAAWQTSHAQVSTGTSVAPDFQGYPARHVCGDIARLDSFRAHLLAIARIERPTDTDHGEDWIGDYELELREPGKEHEDPKLTLRWQKN